MQNNLTTFNPSTLQTHKSTVFVVWILMDKKICGYHKFGQTKMGDVFKIQTNADDHITGGRLFQLNYNALISHL